MSSALHSWTRTDAKPPAHVRFVRKGGGKGCLMVRCSVCGRDVEETLCAMDAVAASLYRHGWSHSSDPKRIACPACCARIRTQRETDRAARAASGAAQVAELTPAQKRAAFCRIAGIPKKEKPIMAETKPVTTAQPPRVSTLADRRRIAEALDARYDADKGCYRGALSDDALAQELNVPRAWVAEVRGLTYGPDTNEDAMRLPREIEALEARLKTLAAETVDHANRGMALMDKVDAALKDLAALQKRAP